MTKDRRIRTVVIASAAYIAAQMLADITSLKIVLIAGLSMDAGTLIYPFTFTLRDLVHKAAGKDTARVLIVTAAAVNLIMALLFQLVASLPPDMEVGAQTEFAAVLAPVWRIVVASIIAEVVAEFIDGEIYELWMKRIGARRQWGRVLASNAVSVPLDSALFVLIAFAGAMPGAVVMGIFISNVVIKGIVTLLSIPWIYLVPASEAA